MIISVFDSVANIVGKGENAGYQHFLLFPQCFEKASIPDTSKSVTVSCLTYYYTIQSLVSPADVNFEKFLRERENARNQHLNTMFSSLSKTEITNMATFNF